jgi:uncharacterized OB-fold protein
MRQSDNMDRPFDEDDDTGLRFPPRERCAACGGHLRGTAAKIDGICDRCFNQMMELVETDGDSY